MNLNDLSRFIDPVILDRGHDYMLDGNIVRIREAGNRIYHAEVEGSDLYLVQVKLDEDNNVVYSDCDCPYDFGPLCKHQAAVLLKLRDQLNPGAPIAGRNPTMTSNQTLMQLLEAESKESLVDLLLSLASDSEVLEQRIKLHISKTGGIEELEECRRLIRSYIESNADRHGFVNWRNVSRAVGGAELAAEKAIEAADREEWIRAAGINLCILEEMVDFLQEADDSDGTIGVVIEESLERIHEIILQIDSISPVEQDTLFQMLLNESGHPRYGGWTDWQLTLLKMASRLAITPDMRSKWETHASNLTLQQTGGAWSRDYFAERVANMRYQLIRTYENAGQADEYLNSHLHFSNFRDMAIQDAFLNGRYQEVIRLAEEGEAQDQAKSLPGLVNQWKKHRYEAYRRAGFIELQRLLGVELILDGDFTYYKQVKETYPAAEWPPVYQDILQKLEQDKYPKEIYTRILVEEQEYSRLLAYVKLRPSRIEQFYKHLIQPYPSEVTELFQTHIEAEADRSSTRKHYGNVCRIIRMLQQVGGKEAALQMVSKLLSKYPKKPAFREELMKLN